MKKLLLTQSKSKSILATCTITTLLLLSACDASMNSTSTESEKAEQTESSNEQISAQQESTPTEANPKSAADFKSGNFFYIARDITDVQLKAGDYITQLQQSQENLQKALDTKDQQLVESTVSTLKTQLTAFNQSLDQLNLKSTEINDIRQNIIDANAQALKSPLMNGEIDFNQLDFNKIEQQLSSVQGEMLKLAAMLIPKGSSSDNAES